MVMLDVMPPTPAEEFWYDGGIVYVAIIVAVIITIVTIAAIIKRNRK